MSFNNSEGKRRSSRLAQNRSAYVEHPLIDLNDENTNDNTSSNQTQFQPNQMNYNPYAMDLLSLSDNDYDVDAPSSNSTDDISNQINNNYPTNGPPYSNSSVYGNTIAPNILEAPLSTSTVSDLQSLVQSLRDEVTALRNQSNSYSTLSPSSTTNATISHDPPSQTIASIPSDNCSIQSLPSQHSTCIQNPTPSQSSSSIHQSSISVVSAPQRYAPDPPEDNPTPCNTTSNSTNKLNQNQSKHKHHHAKTIQPIQEDDESNIRVIATQVK